MNYYNEIDPYAAQWLRNLIKAGLIPEGEVDERSIVDVKAGDLTGFIQCHFFAGLGGWPYAFRLAGWPDDRPAWSGSCPCQPFSTAGERRAFDDSRDLWPVWHRLIRDVRPVALFGEQVDDAVGFGWFDRVRIDLESHGYSVAPPLVVPACSVGAPHRRDRLWFIADNVEHAARERRGEGRPQHELRGRWDAAPGAGGAGDMEHADQRRGERRQFMWSGRDQETSLVVGADGKARRVEPGICLLAHGIPARIPKLRALGNAIVPQLAAEIIGAYLDTED